VIEEKTMLDRPVPAAILAGLIIFSIVTFSLETLPNLDSTTMRLLDYCEYFIVAVFTVEYIYRLMTSPKKINFITSPYGLIDLIAILPFFLSLAIDLRSLRAIRLLRLARLLKLARYTSAFDRLAQALKDSKHELVVSISMLAIAIYLSAFGIYHFEHAAQPEKFRSIFDALWWSVATITTVGYGDIYPITIGGRMFTFLVMLASLGLVAVPTGIFATALLSVKNRGNDI
jgi:voltage-gated potassium channel